MEVKNRASIKSIPYDEFKDNDTLVEQFTWTFVNDDDEHTVLDVQYIDKGGKAVDPVTRAEKPMICTSSGTRMPRAVSAF